MTVSITENSKALEFHLIDVFTPEPLSGNGLSVFLLEEYPPDHVMQSITREMRQFESIFIRQSEDAYRFHARIFTLEEELPFAGHPVIGAAALLHSKLFSNEENARLEFVIQQRVIKVISKRQDQSYIAEMDQGTSAFGPDISEKASASFLHALNLDLPDRVPDLPLQVVSTGLPYLIVPIRSNLENTRIVVADFEARLAGVGAKFVYVFDINRFEGRTWDNEGRVEDVATGSAAGPMAAYLVRHGLASAGVELRLSQGTFVHRPSEIHAMVHSRAELTVTIGGEVRIVGNGMLNLPEGFI
ncbi:PhzF family phenazine biosynthesis protein [Sedimenticola sp.]|uniref:PhzF family phenazine biosynthesis protein n=1 Tax=Sedimenticola sp. TaxID=1940285 RepID=UPI00258F3746|nr:PhzF family phenazine biosynthesis protein [Sedimenticola sp.]MCW8903845.1 PhzF family phenazine biosynthesis protein [Sedimenticola sp.]